MHLLDLLFSSNTSQDDPEELEKNCSLICTLLVLKILLIFLVLSMYFICIILYN